MPKNTRPKLDQRRHIFLVGFSGAGKSTVGPILARRLKAPFFDTDKLIERQTGVSVAELFAHGGEKPFRVLEFDVISTLASKKARSVIALGGGALLRRETQSVVFGCGRVVYLRCAMI